jgi:hypothetical protein
LESAVELDDSSYIHRRPARSSAAVYVRGPRLKWAPDGRRRGGGGALTDTGKSKVACRAARLPGKWGRQCGGPSCLPD